MKKIVSEFNFSPLQLNSIQRLANELKLDELVIKLLFERGADTKEKIETFLHPSRKNFTNPYSLSGMQEVVDLIKSVKDKNGKVAVFGDYDADGVCACSIMHYALKNFGVNFSIYIPERSDGYGLSIMALDRIIENDKPDMIMTVDCGISNHDEIEYIKSKGLLVAVTDHHELPAIIPECVCVNPKFADDYPYDNLCGAGVAFKLAEALLGETAYNVLDLAALATVADSVPLLGENRDIVFEGIKLITEKPRLAFSTLLKNSNDISSQTLAFTIAPKINAAGRVGSARLAFEFFTEEDETKIVEIANKLLELNTERQQFCDEMYFTAKKKLAEIGAYKSVIMLYDDSWSGGFIGIVAARLSEEYNRPVLLFSKKGEMLKGSARSIESINIFEALVACKDVIEEFGGHSQAAGINLKEENFPKLEEKLVKFIDANYEKSIFVPQINICEKVTEPFSMKLATQLNMLEPYGVGNKRPLFYLDIDSMDAQIIKEGSTHVQIRNQLIDMMYFNGSSKIDVLQSDISKHIVFEYNLSTYKGKEYLKGFVKDVIYDNLNSHLLPVYIYHNNLQTLKTFGLNLDKSLGKFQSEVEEEIKNAVNKANYGLCLIASSVETLKKFDCIKDLDINLFNFSSRNLSNSILVSPSADTDLSEFRDIIYLDTPMCMAGLQLLDEQKKKGKNIIYNKDICGYNICNALQTERENLLDIYSLIRNNSFAGSNTLQVALNAKNLECDIYEFIFGLEIFAELGLVNLNKNSVTINKGRKVNLASSSLYNLICDLKNC